VNIYEIKKHAGLLTEQEVAALLTDFTKQQNEVEKRLTGGDAVNAKALIKKYGWPPETIDKVLGEYYKNIIRWFKV